MIQSTAEPEIEQTEAGEEATLVPAEQARDTKAGKDVSAATPKTENARKSRPADKADSEGGTGGKTKAAPSTDDAPQSKAGTAQTSGGAAGPRPVDVFFSSPAEPESSGEASAAVENTPATASDEPVSRQAPRGGRPVMPTVKAPATKKPGRADTGTKPADAGATGATTTEAPPAGRATAARPAPQNEGTVPTSIAVLREIPVGDIQPNPRQPREVFDEEHMAELVTSIREVGVLQPVVVREVSGAVPYELIMGERRWRATQLAGLETIPAIVRHTPDQDLLRDALLENLHRSQLNPLEEAAAYQQLMEDFACTQDELSQRIGRSRPQISNTMRLLRLPPLVQRRVAAGALSAGHARALLGLTDPAEMERLAQRIVADGLSVRATEEAVTQLQGTVRPGPAARRTRGESAHHERLDHFATALTSRLDTNVKITLGARKGRIAIDFASVDDLNRIMDVIQGGTSR
ncbi:MULTISPECIES: ParB/RepB/Spo0J family partition protein [unclassified Micrococcus]|uniref:ParB/RepB/Spo0J family partition protein n=1 Tax=unclassified Micrococcus TaxID=2620948 RepID=UPI0020043620|nr:MULTISPECIES: ParB/RepB/Spo0J family partition protein [unclassified Micrococcus]